MAGRSHARFLYYGAHFLFRTLGWTSPVQPSLSADEDGGRMSDDDHLYRRGVGVMLINAEGLVWDARRIDNREEAWQMPQGGLDKDEEPWTGALRELEEETEIATSLVEKIADHPPQLRYD